MEAGERWMLNDVAGKPIRAWNSRKYAFRTEYDALRRPVRSFVQGGDPAEPQCHGLCAADRLRAHDLWRQRRNRADRGAAAASQSEDARSSSISTARASSPPIFTTSRAIRCAAPASSRATTRTLRTGRKIRRSTARLSPAPPPMTRSTAPSRSPRPTTASIARPSTRPVCWKRSMSICAGAAASTSFRHQYRLQRQGPAHAHRIWQRRGDRICL